ncbi:hypothetical protein ENSA7_42330 [Enhygromyxa salina]|uniref:Uncharacterized protein n=1 Tax=Enhygromyxa salina TaxID=215803 RepID=A0A2S9YLS2_9BACT|nr:hypothetical protein ENSA7_42330 [Enhygromyxa salina]
MQGLEVVAGQREDLFAGPHRLGGGRQIVVPQLGHAPQQRDPLGVGAGDLVLLTQQRDHLVVVAGPIVEGRQRPRRLQILGREVQHLRVQLDRPLRVDLAVAVDLREPLDDLEALARILSAGQLGLLDPHHVVPHARALLDARHLLARLRVAGVRLRHPGPRVDGPVDVAQTPLADLGELDEFLGEGVVVERAGVPGPGRVGGLLDLVEHQVAQRSPGLLAPKVLLVALERLGIEGLALEHLEVEQRRALVIVELDVKHLGGLEQRRGRDRVAELIDTPLEQGRERGPVGAVAIQPLERLPGLAVGGLEPAGLLVADPGFLVPLQPLVEVLGPAQEHVHARGRLHVGQHPAVVIVELHPVGLLGEHVRVHLAGLEVIRAQAQRAPQQLERLRHVAGCASQLRRLQEDAGRLGHALVAGLARAEVQGAKGVEGLEALRRRLDRRLQVPGGPGEILMLVRRDPSQAQM